MHQITSQKTNRKTALKLENWNVGTIATRLMDDVQETNDAQKTTILNEELKRLHVDIATL